MSNPKVFEFAKEIGFTPLALMDKIKEWKLPVRSHMAELEPEMLALIKQRLKEGDAPAPVEKKAAPRKKAAPKAPASKAVAKPTTLTKPGTAVEAKAPAAAPKAGAVVRRKTKAVEETPVEEQEHEEVHESAEAVHEEEVAPAPKAAAAPAAVEAPAPKAAAPAAAVEAPVAKPAPAVQPAASAAPAAAPAPETTAPVAAAPAPAEEKKPLVARKKEVAIGASGVASAGAAPAARRNIVGRMDLSRVQPPPRPGGDRPGGFVPRAPGAGGFQRSPGGPGGGAKPGNLRAGFFRQGAPMQAPPIESLLDQSKKRGFTDKRRNTGTVQEVTTAKENEDKPPVFDAAEFRKREMVFQPKKKKAMLARPAMQTQITQAAAHKRVLKVHGTMKLSNLAAEIGMKAPQLLKVLMKNGVTASMNTDLDFDTIALILPEFGWEAVSALKSVDEMLDATAFGELDAETVIRPPVVTIMGHVDHGKTSLLDAIRSAKVAAGEAGGITQHIGAYQVTLDDGYKITFLDTPGHAAFTAMRARGANVTDIAIIVVAADDGVMPQTAEAINHAKAAGVPIIVAVNKMDKPGANPERVKQQLTEYEIVPEEWGGTTIFAPVSALAKTGLTELLEHIKLVAEVGELKANPKRSGKGTVIESRLEKGRGPVATLLVQDGTIKVGQYIVAGTVPGRVRSLMSYKGERLEEAGPGTPVEVLGLDAIPQAGDTFDVVKDDKDAEAVAQRRRDSVAKAVTPNSKMSLEDMFSKVQKGDLKELPIIVKADVAGSLEAINGMFAKVGNNEVKLKIIHSAVGGITGSDVLLASTAKGIIIGFNVRPDGGATNEARRLNVEIRTYSIVYEMMDDIKKAMVGLLAPTTVEKVNGRAEVRNTFNVPKIGTIGGCFVSDGKIARSNMARLIREGKIVYEGKISSLKRFKDDAREVATGFECGIGIENFNDLKVGDIIEAFSKEEVQRTLDESPTP